MSTAHWNGTVVRVGESGDNDVDSNLTMEQMELRELSQRTAIDDLHEEFRDTIKRVEVVCKPRMQAREEEIVQKKKEKLRRNQEKQTRAK